MDLTDFSNGKLWAITENHLQAMIDRLPEAFGQHKNAASFVENPEDRDDFKLRDGVAIIPVTGPITKRGSFYSFLYGGTPLTQLTDIFMDAISQRDVEAIVFDIDSPGGTITGLEAFADLVFNHRGVKPMAAFAGGMMTSAAYWIGSAADRIVTEKTSDVGSIGVLMIHHDWSKEDEKMGLKRTILKSGKYKALGNDAEPLSDLAQKTFKAELEYVHGLFVDAALTRNRGMRDIPDPDVAEAKIYIGQQAVDVGLADKIGSIDTAIELAQSMIKPKNTFFFKTGAVSGATTKEKLIMADQEKTIETVKDLEAAVPDLVNEIESRAVAGVNVDQQVADAVSAERDRVVGIAVEIMGEEAGNKLKAIIDQGLTVDQFKAVRGAMGVTGEQPSGEEETPEQAAQRQALEALHNASPENPGSGGQIHGDQDFMTLAKAYRAENNCSMTDAMKAIARQNPEAHKKYIDGLQPAGNA